MGTSTLPTSGIHLECLLPASEAQMLGARLREVNEKESSEGTYRGNLQKIPTGGTSRWNLQVVPSGRTSRRSLQGELPEDSSRLNLQVVPSGGTSRIFNEREPPERSSRGNSRRNLQDDP